MNLSEVLNAALEIGPYVIVPKSAGGGIRIVFEFTAIGFPPSVSRRHKWIEIYYDAEGIVTDTYRHHPDAW
jgi:hypothetical protein